MVTVSHDRAFLDEVRTPLNIPLLSVSLIVSLSARLCRCLFVGPSLCLSLSLPVSISVSLLHIHSPEQVCTDVMHISGVAKRLTQVCHLSHFQSLSIQAEDVRLQLCRSVAITQCVRSAARSKRYVGTVNNNFLCQLIFSYKTEVLVAGL